MKWKKILNKESGVLGISGISPDIRDVEQAESNGDERAHLALDAYKYIIAQYIAKYAVSMGGIDVIAFTAGVGENQKNIRKGIIDYLGFMGVELDEKKNDTKSDEREISTENSKIKVYIVPTNEELVIARDTQRIISK